MSEKRCDKCAYWDASETKQAGDQFIVGWCQRAMPFWDATDWNLRGERRLKPEFADRKFFAQDGSDYQAAVFTTPDFFCAEFAAAKGPP